MTIRNLKSLFQPRSVALVGEIDDPLSAGALTAGNLIGGGFGGDIFFVNSQGRSVEGYPAFNAIGARPAAGLHLLRFICPTSTGVMVPRHNLNAGFTHLQPLPGALAFVTQSNAVLASVLEWATHRRIGFSHRVCLGDMIDVDFGDMLDYLAGDYHCRAILLYMEHIAQAGRWNRCGILTCWLGDGTAQALRPCSNRCAMKHPTSSRTDSSSGR